MARTEARIFTSIWDDADFVMLTAGEQRLYFLLLSQPDLTLCGVLTDLPDWWAGMANDTQEEEMASHRDQLVNRLFLVRDVRTKEIWLRSYIRGDRVLESANVTIGMSRAFSAIRSKGIRKGVMDELWREFPEGVLEGLTARFTRENKPFVNRLEKRFVEALHGYAPHHPITPSPVHPVTPSPPPADIESSNSYAVGGSR